MSSWCDREAVASPQEIIGRGGAHRMPDVLWSADRPGGGRLLVLIELQTKSEARMATAEDLA